MARVGVRSQPSRKGGKQYFISTQAFQSQFSLQRPLSPHFTDKKTGDSEKGQGNIKPYKSMAELEVDP